MQANAPLTLASSKTNTKFVPVFKKMGLSLGLGIVAMIAGALWLLIAANGAQWTLSFWLGFAGPLVVLIAILGYIWGAHHSTGNVWGAVIGVSTWVVTGGLAFAGIFLAISSGNFQAGKFFWGVLDFAVLVGAAAVLFLHGWLFKKIKS